MKIVKMKRNKGITLIALIITVIILLILAGVSISLVVGDNGVLTQSQQASTKTAVASFLEEVNMAYADAYAAKMEAGDFSSEMTMTDVYNKMSTDLQNHIYTQEGISTISLVDSSQSSIMLLNDSTAIGSDGLAGHNVIEVAIEENNDSTIYWGEVKGTYYPMKIGTSSIELDKEHTQTTQPVGIANFREWVNINIY